MWRGDRADRVIGCQAWGALAYQLAQLEDAGQDVQMLLHGVPGFVDRAHTPAAFAFRSIEERLEETAARAADGAGGARAAAEGQRAGERDERAAQRQAEQAGPERGAVEQSGVEQVEAERAREQADLHADRAVTHEARAAELAAQGFPVSTKDAVAAAGEKADSAIAATTSRGAGRPAAARPAGGRPATGWPGQQRTPRDPKGR
ncbi:hypothetical protein [Krasilnikovia sp. M28-CT-15]|uniref:hypothetical protein n=1 Tax=Krasilnikovia sp. M28-CT-15 TaxID=3373540 RepID=UPI00399C6D46